MKVFYIVPDINIYINLMIFTLQISGHIVGTDYTQHAINVCTYEKHHNTTDGIIHPQFWMLYGFHQHVFSCD